ncbi:MAG: hypothetical protein H0X37_15835 [Herpetosiphonaceae bacterium]|nr:hypothetical protein [Herpetosiphonaceae bacterium]
MQTAYVIKGHINDVGTLVLDEPTPLTRGPVIVTVLPVVDHEFVQNEYTEEEHASLWQRLDAIAALPDPAAPNDGLSARDAETILYGSQNGPNNVR